MGWIKRKSAQSFCGPGGGSAGYHLVRQGTERTGGGNRGHPLGKMRGEILAVYPRSGTQRKHMTLQEKKQMKSLISDISHQTKIPLAEHEALSGVPSGRGPFLRKGG